MGSKNSIPRLHIGTLGNASPAARDDFIGVLGDDQTGACCEGPEWVVGKAFDVLHVNQEGVGYHPDLLEGLRNFSYCAHQAILVVSDKKLIIRMKNLLMDQFQDRSVRSHRPCHYRAIPE